MKIAVCLSGQIRSMADFLSNFHDSVLEPYGCDLYGYVDSSDMNLDIRNLDIIKMFNRIEFSNEQLDIYDPIAAVNPDAEDVLQVGYKIKKNLRQRYLRQLKGIQTAFDLIDRDYDIVVRSRFDVIYHKFDLSDFEPGYIFVPTHDGWHGFCDRLFYGDYKTMKIATHVYDNLTELYTTYQHPIVHPETNFALNLHHHKVNVKKSECKIDLFRYGQVWHHDDKENIESVFSTNKIDLININFHQKFI